MSNERKIIADERAESVCIATLIYHLEFLAHVDFLKPNYFYDMFNKCIAWGLSELWKSGITEVNALNLGQILESNKAVDNQVKKYNISLSEYIETAKYSSVNTIEEFMIYVKSILDKAYKRELLNNTIQVQKELYNDESDISSLTSFVDKSIDDLSEKFIVDDDIHLFGEEVDELWEEITDDYNDNGIPGIPSKIDKINDYVTYETGEVVLLAAERKKGKSVFAMNEALHKVQNGIPTLVIDSEMTNRRWFERLLANVSGVPIKQIKSGKYGKIEADKLKKAREEIKGYKLVHKYMPVLDLNKIYSTHRILINRMGLQFSVFDYLKDNTSVSMSDQANRLGMMADFLKNRIAGELSISCLALAQLNREGLIGYSHKIEERVSTGLVLRDKTADELRRDGLDCGTMCIECIFNRNGDVTDEDDYIDVAYDKSLLRMNTPKQIHKVTTPFDEEDKK